MMIVKCRKEGPCTFVEHVMDGKLHGKQWKWDLDGRLLSESMWMNGMKSGISRYWNILGSIYKETTYVEGKVEKEVYPKSHYHSSRSEMRALLKLVQNGAVASIGTK